MSESKRYDPWLKDGGPAALISHESLEPSEGADAVFFPPTYAPAEDKSKFAGGYNIDVFPSDERSIGYVAAAMIKDGRLKPTVDLFPTSPNVCLVDSVGAQANRIEPLFEKPRFRHLVPQIEIKIGEKTINMLRAGHRAGDALIRFSKAGESAWEAFQAILHRGDAEPMAKFAPTSLLFGVWDSRGTQVKVPRAFRAVIRAHNVQKLTRSAQFNRATKFVEEGVIAEELDAGDGDKNPLSREGFKDSPATASHGGVRALGEIRRETTINLAAIRRLHAATGENPDSDAEEHLKLRRYVLGLALVAATAASDDQFDLREGCQLRQKPDTEIVWHAVPFRGKETVVGDLSDATALRFADDAARSFGVGPSNTFVFDKATAEKWLALKKDEQDKRRRNGPMTKQFTEGQEAEASGEAPASGGRRRRSKGE